MTITIDELMQKSHTMAVDKGWWPDGTSRSIAEQVNNFHAEISEAWEEYRAGRMETWYWKHHQIEGEYRVTGTPPTATYKPEGFWVEIADLLIRLADTMGAYGWKYFAIKDTTPYEDVPKFVTLSHSRLAMLIADDYRWAPKSDCWIRRAMQGALEAAEANGVDLLALCELKMTYNATRPIRHGGKRA